MKRANGVDFDYDLLPETVDASQLNGVGIADMTAKCVQRTPNKAMYLRWDGTYEVFRIKISREKEIFGRTYPPREVYPGNEDFGTFAWCYKDKDMALKRYEDMPDTLYRVI